MDSQMFKSVASLRGSRGAQAPPPKPPDFGTMGIAQNRGDEYMGGSLDWSISEIKLSEYFDL